MKRKTASNRIWTRLTQFISYHNNHNAASFSPFIHGCRKMAYRLCQYFQKCWRRLHRQCYWLFYWLIWCDDPNTDLYYLTCLRGTASLVQVRQKSPSTSLSSMESATTTSWVALSTLFASLRNERPGLVDGRRESRAFVRLFVHLTICLALQTACAIIGPWCAMHRW